MKEESPVSTPVEKIEQAKTVARAENVPRRGNSTEGEDTLQIYKLLDVDEDTLFFWVKAMTGVWPLSVHLSEDEERAVVKIPRLSSELGELHIAL